MDDILELFSYDWEEPEEPATEGISDVFKKIWDSILWLLDKTRHLLEKLIDAIRGLFSKNYGYKSGVIISTAMREYDTMASKIMKEDSDTAESFDVRTIPGTNKSDPNVKAPTDNDGPVSYSDVREYRKVLLNTLENFAKECNSYSGQVEAKVKEMQNIANSTDMYQKIDMIANISKNLTNKNTDADALNKNADTVAKATESIRSIASELVSQKDNLFKNINIQRGSAPFKVFRVKLFRVFISVLFNTRGALYKKYIIESTGGSTAKTWLESEINKLDTAAKDMQNNINKLSKIAQKTNNLVRPIQTVVNSMNSQSKVLQEVVKLLGDIPNYKMNSDNGTILQYSDIDKK